MITLFNDLNRFIFLCDYVISQKQCCIIETYDI